MFALPLLVLLEPFLIGSFHRTTSCYARSLKHVRTERSIRSKSSDYDVLGKALSYRFSSSSEQNHVAPSKISSILQSLSAAQTTLKSLDGISHELYQRTHSTKKKTSNEYSQTNPKNEKESVLGRASRSASRTGSCADAFLACELCIWLQDFVLSTTPDSWNMTNYTNTTVCHGVNNAHWREDKEQHGTLQAGGGREIIYSSTFDHKVHLPGGEGGVKKDIIIPVSIVVLFEPNYSGGAGFQHGGIDALLMPQEKAAVASDEKPRGRILILLQDGVHHDLEKTIQILDVEPEYFELNVGLLSKEIASVNGNLWRCAAQVLEKVGPVVLSLSKLAIINNTIHTETMNGNDQGTEVTEMDRTPIQHTNAQDKIAKETLSATCLPAIHFVGQSIAGGIASLAATMMEGSVPLPPLPKNRTKRKKNSTVKKIQSKRNEGGDLGSKDKTHNHLHLDSSHGAASTEDTVKKSAKVDVGAIIRDHTSIHGYGQGRTSAVAIGAPPCLSPNIKAAFITSIIHGDDVVSRSTKKSLDRLCERVDRSLRGGILSNKIGWMSDAVSLTVSGVMSHAHGSEGEESRLALPGKVYLIRPRHYGGASSMHEVRGTSGGGREALRATVLWQLNDILLSKSLWTHHELKAYIHGLDRVQLREFRLGGNVHGDDDYDDD